MHNKPLKLSVVCVRACVFSLVCVHSRLGVHNNHDTLLSFQQITTSACVYGSEEAFFPSNHTI